MLSLTPTASTSNAILRASQGSKPLQFGSAPKKPDAALEAERAKIEKAGFEKSSWGIIKLTWLLMAVLLVDTYTLHKNLTQNIDQCKQLSQQHDALAHELDKAKEKNLKPKAEKE